MIRTPQLWQLGASAWMAHSKLSNVYRSPFDSSTSNDLSYSFPQCAQVPISASDHRLEVDCSLRDPGQQPVRLSFFLQTLLEQIGGAVVPELLGVCPGHAVAGHLVVLDSLRGGDDAGMEDVGLGVLLEERSALLDQPRHPLALVASGTELRPGEDLFEPRYLPLRRRQVVAERFLEILVVGGLDHLGERLDELLLGAVEILELVDVELGQRIEVHGPPRARDVCEDAERASLSSGSVEALPGARCQRVDNVGGQRPRADGESRRTLNRRRWSRIFPA